MHSTSVPLLLAAAASVGFLHSILPDHWVPLAVIARTQRWSLFRVARVSFLASIGHVATSIVLAGLIAIIGLQFRSALESQQSHIVGIILVLTGVGFLFWALVWPEHAHGHHHNHDHDHDGAHPDDEHSPARRMAAIVVPFGAAASPDLTVLPVALAAAAVSSALVGGVLLVFSVTTLATFVVLTVAATAAGYQVKGEWLEEHGTAISGGVLIVIGIVVFLQVV